MRGGRNKVPKEQTHSILSLVVIMVRWISNNTCPPADIPFCQNNYCWIRCITFSKGCGVAMSMLD